mgnify:FL=1
MSVLDQPSAAPRKKAGNLLVETILDVTHYTDTLFSFKATRSPAFRFESGQFTMIGLEVDGRPLLRAYSMASAVYDDNLEFFSIKVADGPLTSRLQHIRPGDEILIGPKPTGTLVNGYLRPGRRLVLLATGTGFAPFASLLRDPETYERYDTVVMALGCRTVDELTFANGVVGAIQDHELLGELAAGKLHYYPTITRETFRNQGRVSDLVASGKLFADLGLPTLDLETDRVMICGNPGLITDVSALLHARGFEEGSSGTPADFVIEKAFVQR